VTVIDECPIGRDRLRVHAGRDEQGCVRVPALVQRDRLELDERHGGPTGAPFVGFFSFGCQRASTLRAMFAGVNGVRAVVPNTSP
jgi:hypothetical protein